MATVKKKAAKNNTETKAVVEYYYKFKNASMVFIKGNFFRGGFSISKNKVKAIIDNSLELKKFVGGEYDEGISKLQEDEVIEL